MGNEGWKSRGSDVELEKWNYENEKRIGRVTIKNRGVMREGITGEVIRNEKRVIRRRERK